MFAQNIDKYSKFILWIEKRNKYLLAIKLLSAYNLKLS